jgi:hypothetical protein
MKFKEAKNENISSKNYLEENDGRHLTRWFSNRRMADLRLPDQNPVGQSPRLLQLI